MRGLFWGAHKSLAPRARTLLGGLGQATLSSFAVATLLFVLFGECPKFCDLAKQRRKIVGGVSEVGKDDFSLFFFWRCVIFLVFFFFCSFWTLRKRAHTPGSSQTWLASCATVCVGLSDPRGCTQQWVANQYAQTTCAKRRLWHKFPFPLQSKCGVTPPPKLYSKRCFRTLVVDSMFSTNPRNKIPCGKAGEQRQHLSN